jgi:hypothetical protein
LVLSLLTAIGMSILPDSAGADEPPPPPAPATQPGSGEIEEKLDQKLPPLRFENVPLADVIDYLHDLTKINFDVDWDALKGVGVNKDSRVTLRLRSRKLSEAMEAILDEVTNKVRIVYQPQKDRIVITTEKKVS